MKRQTTKQNNLQNGAWALAHVPLVVDRSAKIEKEPGLLALLLRAIPQSNNKKGEFLMGFLLLPNRICKIHLICLCL
jgi:hypothetical protein